MNNIQTAEYLNFTIYNAQNLPIDFLTMIMITIRIMIVTDWVGNVVEVQFWIGNVVELLFCAEVAGSVVPGCLYGGATLGVVAVVEAVLLFR